MQITISDVVRFSVARLETGIECDLTKAADPQAAALVIFNYGLRRYVNDKTGGEGLTDEKRLEKANEAIEALLTGEAKSRAGGPRLAPWVAIYRKTIEAFLLTHKVVSKVGDAAKLAAAERADLLDLICKTKPDWNRDKVSLKLDGFQSDAQATATPAGDLSDLI